MQELTLFDEDDHETSGPTGSLVRVRLSIAYDGTDFRGLAPNVDVRTVVGELVRVLTPLFGFVPEIVMSGRTDAGVHAAHQVLSFDAPEDKVDLERIAKVINQRLGPEVVATDVVLADSSFSARFDATGRRYRYRIMNRPTPDPFSARFAWWVPQPLNVAVMQLACEPFLGEQDFSSFCKRPKVGPGEEPLSLVRRITEARWSDLGDGELVFEIAGSAFCHQMVRSIVGFHVAVGRGKRSAGEVRGVLAARDRQAAEQPAPPHGLTLVDIAY
jgi:tRNA pseudouridine38-40 synthase